MSKFTRVYSILCCWIVGYLMLESVAMKASTAESIFMGLALGLGLIIPALDWILTPEPQPKLTPEVIAYHQKFVKNLDKLPAALDNNKIRIPAVGAFKC